MIGNAINLRAIFRRRQDLAEDVGEAMKRLIFVALAILALGGCQSGGSYFASGYGDYNTIAGGPRGGAHAGIDFVDARGAPVLAAAGGRIFKLREDSGCGNGVIIEHKQMGVWNEILGGIYNWKYTVYCHLDGFTDLAKKHGLVQRGDVIGFVGDTGKATSGPHVHFELTTDAKSHASGSLEGTEDPAKYLVGCFDPKKTYPPDKLTHPVACSDK